MTNVEKIYSYLRNIGCTYDGAVGIIGNLQGETSDFNPISVEGMSNPNSYLRQAGLTETEYTRRADNNIPTVNGKYFIRDAIGYGIVQWTYWERKQNLLNYAKNADKSIGDLDLQLNFMIQEVKNKYTTAWKVAIDGSKYTKVVKIWVEDYEKPANVSRAIETRTQYAKYWYNYFKNWNATPETEKPQPGEKPNQPSLVDTDRRKVVKMALAQLGYREKRTNTQLDDTSANAGTNNYTKYARDLDSISGFYNGKKNGYAWCDIFVDWCFVQSYGVTKALELLCQKMGSSGAGCTYSMGYYRNKKQFIRRSVGKPQVGDQIFFGTGLDNSTHTGLVVAVDDSKVYTVEGNTNDNPTVVAEGIGVYYKSYPLNKTSIIGYGRPNYNDGYIGNGFELQGKEDTGSSEDANPPIVEPIIPEDKPQDSNGVYDRRKLIDVAVSQIGYLEKRSEKNLDDFTANYGENDYTKYARDLDAIPDYYYHDRKQGLSWCDIFCDWCFVQAYGFEGSLKVNCQPKKSYGAGCDMSAKYYREAGRLDKRPQVGDQFFIHNWTHTGIVIEVRNHSVVTIEGNQYNSNGKQSVSQKVRLLSEIDGFGHPRYNDGLEGRFYWNKDRTDLKPTGKIDTPVKPTPEPVETEPEPSVPVTGNEDKGIIFETLFKGSKNKMLVKVLQTILKHKGYSIGFTGVDGDFGSATYNALVKFQKNNGINADGICRMDTWKKLFKK